MKSNRFIWKSKVVILKSNWVILKSNQVILKSNGVTLKLKFLINSTIITKKHIQIYWILTLCYFGLEIAICNVFQYMNNYERQCIRLKGILYIDKWILWLYIQYPAHSLAPSHYKTIKPWTIEEKKILQHKL